MNNDYDHQNPENWIIGFLYFNKKDPRLFPPKIWGMGWTINFANPYSILFVIGTIVLPLILTLFLGN